MTEPKVTLERVAELIVNKNLWYGCAVNDHDDLRTALRDYKLLREKLLSAKDALEAGADCMDAYAHIGGEGTENDSVHAATLRALGELV